MRRGFRTLVVAAGCAAGCAAGTAPAHAQTPVCGPADGKLALVLSGGGAKGFAHVGVLRMLDSLGIVPDLVVGTSAGAIIGALYSSGLDVPDLMRDIMAMGLDTLVGRYGATTPPSLGDRRAILVWEGGARGFELQTSVVRETPLNALMSALYLRGNLLARGDFDRLPIPFRAVAADLRTREEVVLASGDLALAVRASSSIPIVFRTVRLGGRDLVDGGIASNVPIAVARSLGAQRLIVSTLRDTAAVDLSKDDPLTVAAQLVNLLFEQPLPGIRPGDLFIQSEVSGLSQLDFSLANIDRAMAAGERAANALKRDRCLPRGKQRPRGVLPPLASAITRPESDPDVARLLRVSLGDVATDGSDLPGMQRRLRGLSLVERYRAVWLHPESGVGDSVVLAPTARPSSIEQLLAGAAFDRELGPRLWVGHVKRLSRYHAEATDVIEIGDMQLEAAATLRRSHDVLRSPWSPLLAGTVRRTRVRDIRGGKEYPEITTADWTAEIGIERRVSRRSTVALTALALQWDEPVFAGSPIAPGVRWRLQRLKIGNTAHGQLSIDMTPRYWRGALNWRVHRQLRGMSIEPAVSAVVGEHLPLQSRAYLGGNDIGFPGFLIQEFGGAQSAMGAVNLSHPFFGPVRFQGMVAGAMLQKADYGFFRDALQYFGVRTGIGIVTALGNVSIEYGVNDRGRRRVHFRFGDWF